VQVCTVLYRMVLCCVPQDVVECVLPDILDTKFSVRVFCSNPLCWQSGVVHQGCFYKWEERVVRYLVTQEMNLVDSAKMDSLLWTKEMWGLPLPASLTQCRCGEGELRVAEDNEEIKDVNELKDVKEVSEDIPALVVNESTETLVIGANESTETGCDGGIEDTSELNDIHEEIPPEVKNPDSGSWEVVSRAKARKKAHHINVSKNAVRSQKRRFSDAPKKQSISPPPVTGPDPVKRMQTVVSGQAEGRRDSSGLIHCCSCKTVHTSLPDFIKHCKSIQHNKLALGDAVYKGDAREEVSELQREVDHIKKCLVEVMKQGLERDITASSKFDELKELCEDELSKKDAVLALLCEKFMALEENLVRVEEKVSKFSKTLESNEEELDSCFDCCKELTKSVADISKELKSVERKTRLVSESGEYEEAAKSKATKVVVNNCEKDQGSDSGLLYIVVFIATMTVTVSLFLFLTSYLF